MVYESMKKDTEKTLDSLERIWSSAVNDGYQGGVSHEHYIPTGTTESTFTRSLQKAP